MMIDGIEIGADFLSKHRPHSRGTPAPAPTCITAFSLTSLPDLLAANLDAVKMKGGLGALADLLGRLMQVDWSATTENMPTCDHSQPLSTCTDFTDLDSCFGATTNLVAPQFSCTWAEFYDEGYNTLYTADGEPRGICSVQAWDDRYEVVQQCHFECEAMPSSSSEVAIARKIDCYRACDAEYGICTRKVGSHAEVLSRDFSDGFNHEILAHLRDFLNEIAGALPDADTRSPNRPQPNTAMDIFRWLESSSDAAKWAAVARQAGDILAALDDVDVMGAYLSICNEVAARFDATDEHFQIDCDGASSESSEEDLLNVQVGHRAGHGRQDCRAQWR